WAFFLEEKKSGTLTDPGYVAAHDYGMPMATALVGGVFAKEKLDAIIYATAPQRPGRIGDPLPSFGTGVYPSPVANLTGFPELVVPAGFTTDDLPVTLSFLGTAFSE